MQNVILVIHLIVALCLIASVLLQRSEGGALGIGGGGGGLVSSRGSATALSKLTWGLAAVFITTSITLAILSGGDPAGRSVLEEVQGSDGAILLPDLPPVADDGAAPLLPPAATGTAPGTPAEPAPAPASPPSAD